MKNPRDILLVGTGFLLGMVFCYFLTAAWLVEPKAGNTAVSFPASRATNLLATGEANPFPRKAEGVHIQEPAVRWVTQSRYVPVRRLDDVFRVKAPGVLIEPSAGQYDLIDFNYVPDFNLP